MVLRNMSNRVCIGHDSQGYLSSCRDETLLNLSMVLQLYSSLETMRWGKRGKHVNSEKGPRAVCIQGMSGIQSFELSPWARNNTLSDN